MKAPRDTPAHSAATPAPDGFAIKIEAHEIRAFRVVVEQNGFRRAADKLGISSSAISQSLANLEYKLAAPLIVRRGRSGSIALTEIGQRFLRYVTQLAMEEKAMLEDIDLLKVGHRQKLELLCNHTFASYYSAAAIKQLNQRLPHLRVRIEVLPSRKIIYEILRQEKEIAAGPFQTHMHLYDTIKLFDEKRYLVMHRDSPHLAALRKKPYATLKKIPLLTSYLDDPAARPEGGRIRDYFQVVWEIDNVDLRLQLLREGIGVTYISSVLYHNTQLSAELEILEELPFGNIDRPFGIYYKKGLLLSEAARAFIDICREQSQAG
jgi:DNA-binding transcriptional LysR family regulator